MSKKYVAKFLKGNKVSFKNEYESQMFGFFLIYDIIIYKENIRYQLIDLNNNLIDGLYKEDDLILIESNTEIKKKKKKSKPIKLKKIKNVNLPKLNVIVGYRLSKNTNTIIKKFNNFQTFKQVWKYVKSQKPNAEFMFYQVLSFSDKIESEKIEENYNQIFEKLY